MRHKHNTDVLFKQKVYSLLKSIERSNSLSARCPLLSQHKRAMQRCRYEKQVFGQNAFQQRQ
jgi:hypothetical protein